MVKTAAKAFASFLCALFCVAMLSCGGGGGGGGGASLGGSSSFGTKTLSIDINGLMGGARASSRPDKLNWTQIDLTVYVNDKIVYNESIPKGNNDVIRVEHVKIGSEARAEAKIHVAAENVPREAKSDTITVEAGTNKLTLYVPYRYTISNGETTDGWYTLRSAIELPQKVTDDAQVCVRYTDSMSTDTYKPGIVTGLTGDRTFTGVFEKPYPDYTIVRSATGFSLSGGASATGTVTIPGKIGDEPMVTLANKCFMSNTAITAVIIEEGVKRIGLGAFSGCTALASVTLPSTLTTIDQMAFYNCKALTDLTIPGSVTSIHSTAFESCSGLQTLTVEWDTPPAWFYLNKVNLANTIIRVPNDADKSAWYTKLSTYGAQADNIRYPGE